MATRMLIDAAHPEETRVIVQDGNRLEEFDFETASKKPLKGNIYLAKVTRVEPSLQAAFVEYGGNRHGFIPFAEIHPDYYQIPKADREALLAAQQEEARREEEEEDEAPRGGGAASETPPEPVEARAIPETQSRPDLILQAEPAPELRSATPASLDAGDAPAAPVEGAVVAPPATEAAGGEHLFVPPAEGFADVGVPGPEPIEATNALEQPAIEPTGDASTTVTEVAAPVEVESLGGDVAEDEAEDEDEDERGAETPRARRPRQRHIRSYRIQEVIKRRQILLIQVVKEERGTKGAALTTYLSLAGRYCVLMPNSPRGGGVSRKIANPADRKRLKAIAADLDAPPGMGVILRTAGMNRSKPEIRRDFEYLLRLWDSIRELTMRSTAPALVYEEANLIKRSIRDLFHGEIDEIQVEGDQGYETAREFMATLMPSHADRVRRYDGRVPLFQRFQVEQQLDGIHSPQVQLRSGGTIVFGQTEALVAIDVNSGKATRERNIEETATKTNLEAAEEIARQLRLRDLAGLIVIDFIDMEDGGNNRAVERKLKECLKSDRARIQVGRISPFGLLEMSRQRLRPSLMESSTIVCPHCRGAGVVRSTETSALIALRAIEDEGIKDRAAELAVAVPPPVAHYLLNHKRGEIAKIEARYAMTVTIAGDAALVPPEFRIERVRPRQPGAAPAPSTASQAVTHDTVRPPELRPESEAAMAEAPEDEVESVEGGFTPEAREDAGHEPAAAQGGEERNGGRGRRRRRRRRGRGGEEFQDRGPRPQQEPRPRHGDLLNNPPPLPAEVPAEPGAVAGDEGATESRESGPSRDQQDDQPRRGRRRRGRRGGRGDKNERGDRGPRERNQRASSEDADQGHRPSIEAPRAEPAYVPAPAPVQAPVAPMAPPPVATAPEPVAPPEPAKPKYEVVTVPAEPTDPTAPRRSGWWRK